MDVCIVTERRTAETKEERQKGGTRAGDGKNEGRRGDALLSIPKIFPWPERRRSLLPRLISVL